jgi:hypothetical protein
MITSQQLLEVYKDSFKHNIVNIPVYVNPTYDDFKELNAPDIRFSANFCTKEVYIWDATLALHYIVREKLRLQSCGESLFYWWTGILEGVAIKEGNRYVMTSSDCFYQGFKEMRDEMMLGHRDNARVILFALRDVLEYNWAWVEKYITVRHWLGSSKEMITGSLEDINKSRS